MHELLLPEKNIIEEDISFTIDRAKRAKAQLIIDIQCYTHPPLRLFEDFEYMELKIKQLERRKRLGIKTTKFTTQGEEKILEY